MKTAQVISPPQSVSLPEPDVSFLIVGGLGGIGRAVAFWLMDKGAKNVLIVSRNAEEHVEAAALLEKAERGKCNLKIHNCDVSSEKSLIRLLNHVRDSMPPIRGVIDAAMALDVRIIQSL